LSPASVTINRQIIPPIAVTDQNDTLVVWKQALDSIKVTSK
jgi:hypothetical protein